MRAYSTSQSWRDTRTHTVSTIMVVIAENVKTRLVHARRFYGTMWNDRIVHKHYSTAKTEKQETQAGQRSRETRNGKTKHEAQVKPNKTTETDKKRVETEGNPVETVETL